MLGTLSLLFAVAVFVIVVMIIQRCQQGKGNDDVVMATCACTRSSRGMEEKSLATQIGWCDSISLTPTPFMLA